VQANDRGTSHYRPFITGAKPELAAALSASLKNLSTSALKVWWKYGTAQKQGRGKQGDSSHFG
jgi:hypothetical protein